MSVPIYEYRCTGCNEVFEYMQRMSEEPKTECEACGDKLERLISASAFHLKGGGWYSDLYSSVKKDGATKGDVASTAGDSSSDSGGGDSTKSSSSDGGSKDSTTKTGSDG